MWVMTEEQYLATNGHCFELLPRASSTMLEYEYRRCKHCGLVQRRRIPVPIVTVCHWEDIPQGD